MASESNEETLQPSHGEQAHPKERTYVKVAVILAIVTAIEIWVSYLGMPDWATVVSLLVLSIIKFVAVVGYFMHLKFDSRALRKPFIGGLVLALAVYTIVLLAFTLHDDVPAGL